MPRDEPPRAFFAVSGGSVGRGRRQLVEELDLVIGPGDVAVVSGVNGCGKTTLLRAVAGLHPLAGEVRRDGGRSWLAATDDQRIPLTVSAYLRRMAGVHGLGRAQRGRRVDEVVDALRLGDVADAPTATLSTGWRRRVGVAQALLGGGGLAVLDEPDAGLDDDAAAVVWRALRHHARAGGAVLVATPNDRAARSATTALVIDGGRLVPARPEAGTAAADGVVEPVVAGGGPPYDLRLVAVGPDAPRPSTGASSSPSSPPDSVASVPAVAEPGDEVILVVAEAELDATVAAALAAGWSVRSLAPRGRPPSGMGDRR